MESHLILVGAPSQRHVPYFAMSVPRSRENYYERLDLAQHLARLIGRRCAGWVQSRAEGERVELIATRNYIPPQTAFYASWLRFRDAEGAAEFLAAYPQHRLDGRMAKLEADREALIAKLQHRLKRGDFNLGRIGDAQQRENLARRYVEAAEALRSLSSALKLLERARQVAPLWRQEL
jgi:hypothetical protein